MAAYTTNKVFAERSGLGIRIIYETVGTGRNSGGTQSFDLDNDNIITGTYTLRYGTVDSNELTSLTEDTDYNLDKESGRVLILGTGTSVSGTARLGKNVLYSTYTYIESFSDDTVTDLVQNASDQIDKLTGRRWGSG